MRRRPLSLSEEKASVSMRRRPLSLSEEKALSLSEEEASFSSGGGVRRSLFLFL